MKKNNALLLLSLCFLSACGSDVKKSPKYEDLINVVRFNQWVVDGCHLVHSQMDLTMQTDGRLSNNSLRLNMAFKPELRGIPDVRLNTLNIPLYVEGKNQRYSFEIPYDPALIATLQQDYTYIFVRFYPSSTAQPIAHEAYFATSGLAAGLAYLERECGNKRRLPWQG